MSRNIPSIYALCIMTMALVGLGPQSQRSRLHRKRTLARRGQYERADVTTLDDAGQFNVGGILTLAFVIVGAFVTVTIVASLAPSFITSVADLNNELSTADLNDTTATTVIQLMPVLIGIGAAVGLTLLALAAVQLRRN